MTPTPTPRRKKWTEAEERTLIDKYRELVVDGILGKMKTREKKFKPIACCVNSLHHDCDPVAFPWQWTWKDVSTKVQNMRHQYLLVKQKIKKPVLELEIEGYNGGGDMSREEFDWLEGLTHWSNFLRYKEVFGDVPLASNGGQMVGNGVKEGHEGFCGGMEIGEFEQHSADGDFGVGNGVLELGFDYDDGDAEENYGNHNESGHHLGENGDGGFPYDEDVNGSILRKKRKVVKGLEKKALGFIANQLSQLKKMEAQFEQREIEREQERQRRDAILIELEQARLKRWEAREKAREEREIAREELIRQRNQQWEVIAEESDERERTRREERLDYESGWVERLNRRREEWKKQMDNMLSQHRAEMGQVQARILHEQQNLTSQLLGIVTQWTGPLTELPDQGRPNNHYFSQLMQNMHHDSEIDHDDTRVEGDDQDDQFIVGR